VFTWLLLLQKAAGQKPQSTQQKEWRAQESPMANDGFKAPEVPEAFRDAMKMSIEQAKRAFDTFAATSEQTWKGLEATPFMSSQSLRSLNAKIAEITRSNAEANFALALKLAESKDLGEAMELQADYLRKQMDIFFHQLEEVRDLAAQVIQDATPQGIGPAPGGAAKS
jgi:phasin